MKTPPVLNNLTNDYRTLSSEQLLALLTEKDAQLTKNKRQLCDIQNNLQSTQKHLQSTQDNLHLNQRHLLDRDLKVSNQADYIRLLEEYLRLAKAQKFGASSEKLAYQISLFDEAELEVALDELEDQLPDDDKVISRGPKTRRRGFSPELNRIRIELKLTEQERLGAQSTFFTKTKEELEYIPAKLNVLEYWQEKAVFSNEDGSDTIIGAQRPAHPLGKCFASISLLAYIIVAKYADGLPLYRLENILKRSGAELNRSTMAQWIIRLENIFNPLLQRVRFTQNSGDYLQADETRLQVLKEPGKTAQSDKWMWVIRGGPPEKPSVLFDYDPSRAGSVAERLLDGFSGVLQADGYSGYSQVCKKETVTRIGCMDHARRKFVEAIKAAEPAKGTKRKGQPSKADVALSKIRQLYRIETSIKDKDNSQRFSVRQELAVPILDALKIWLEKNISKVLKGGHTYKAMYYMLNQWPYLVGYCDDGKLNISNALAENAIRPFAIGRKAWLFADTPQGAKASAACYSLIETAKANDIDPYTYILHVLQQISEADTPEKLDALLPWNTALEKIKKS